MNYISLDVSETVDLLGRGAMNKDLVKFTDFEINFIKKEFPNYKIEIHATDIFSLKFPWFNVLIITYKKNIFKKKYILVYRIDDEYYLYIDNINNIYCKCDQIDGLIECLKAKS